MPPLCNWREAPGDEVCRCLGHWGEEVQARVCGCGCLSPGSVPDNLCDLGPVPSALWASDKVRRDGLSGPFLLKLSGDESIWQKAHRSGGGLQKLELTWEREQQSQGAVLKKKPRPLTGHVSVKEVACLDVGTTSKAGTQRSQPATSGIQRGQVWMHLVNWWVLFQQKKHYSSYY